MQHGLLFILIAISFSCLGQWYKPPMGPIFCDNEVQKVKITIHPDSLESILSHVDSYHEYPATFNIQSAELNDTIDNIGFRIRGNTSRYNSKKII